MGEIARILVCWLGFTDLRAMIEPEQVGFGPIGEAVRQGNYDLVVLLNNYPPEAAAGYPTWLKNLGAPEVLLYQEELRSPTHYGDIYQVAVRRLSRLRQDYPRAKFTFHLSPGTPAMAAVWIILAKTRFPATLIESSREHGVRTVSFPFELAAEFLPEVAAYSPPVMFEHPPTVPAFAGIIYRSDIMRRTIEKARLVASRNVPVLLEGESGTGKELLARAIHQASPRKDRLFLAVNCGAIPAELLESEFFGYVRGAFTGADRDRKGYFEEAEGGTLFLDEIGELPLALQVKLLRALEHGEIYRLGSRQPRKVDVRIIAATNRSLLQEVAAGNFRADLFYRLAVAVIQLPPLRQRPGDVSLLIDHMLEEINRICAHDPGKWPKKLAPAARNLLLQHSWPGNVRELSNTLYRAAIWCQGERLELQDIREALLPPPGEPLDQVLNRSLGDGFSLPGLLSQVARHYLERALKEAGGNKTRAAKLLGLPSYQTLDNWLKKYGVAV